MTLTIIIEFSQHEAANIITEKLNNKLLDKFKKIINREINYLILIIN